MDDRIIMKQFKFSLESLLKIRGHNLEKREAELGKFVSSFNTVQSSLNENRQENNRVWAKERSDLYAFSNDYLYLERLSVENSMISTELQEKRKLMDAERLKYNKAFQELKSVELLRAKQLKVHKKELLKEEYLFTEEISSRKLSQEKH